MSFDYDLFVIGGGSGGVRAARVAAGETGAKVALAEEDRYGGTCVIRGCVPKKLMVFASGYSSMVEDAQAYGWNIQPGRDAEPGVLYAGIQPAALFKSTDSGQTWEINEGLYDHPHRGKFFPGAGGLALHTILPHPADLNQMWVAISTGGTYYTADGGETWAPRNKNVRADFSPDKFPEFGQCTHKMVFHPSNPNRVYQQNHCGMYRSDDGGLNWIDIGEGKLPSRFGFPIVVHPHEPDTIFIVPEEADQYRLSIDGKFVVWRSRDAGETWEPLTNGLPDPAYLVALRGAMTTDDCSDAGIYVGTSTGQIFASRDGGDSWYLLADYLPPIYSLEAVVIES